METFSFDLLCDISAKKSLTEENIIHLLSDIDKFATRYSCHQNCIVPTFQIFRDLAIKVCD